MAFHGIGNSSGSIDCARPLADRPRSAPRPAGRRPWRPRTATACAAGAAAPGRCEADDRLVGPVIPTSVMGAVPLGRMRASAVGTWCRCRAPPSATTSRCQPIACFSLVASAWKSTRITLTLPARPATSLSASSNWRVEGRHEDLAFEVDGGDRDARRRLADVQTAAGVAARIVGGTQNGGALVEERQPLLLVPDVVAADEASRSAGRRTRRAPRA